MINNDNLSYKSEGQMYIKSFTIYYNSITTLYKTFTTFADQHEYVNKNASSNAI